MSRPISIRRAEARAAGRCSCCCTQPAPPPYRRCVKCRASTQHSGRLGDVARLPLLARLRLQAIETVKKRHPKLAVRSAAPYGGREHSLRRRWDLLVSDEWHRLLAEAGVEVEGAQAVTGNDRISPQKARRAKGNAAASLSSRPLIRRRGLPWA